jgi:hypothetical protein
MESNVTTNTPITAVYSRKFQVSFGVLGGVGTVIWASQTGRKGKFWWWVGGSLAGQAIGYLIDGMVNK